MFLEFKDRLVKKFKNKQGARPLVSSRGDLELVKKVKGRRFPSLKQFGHIKKILSSLERRIVFFSTLVFVFGVLLFGLNFVLKNTVKIPKVGGKYIEAVMGSPQLVNPIFATTNDVDVDLVKLIFSGLMRYDKNQKLVRDLAASYEISEDKKTYSFKLREDVLWHDGTPFTARDVAFTIRAIQDKSVGSPLYVSFQGVELVVVDDYTIVFKLKEPFAPFLSILTVGVISENIWSEVIPDRMRLHNQNLQPVGTGPFMFKKLTKDDTGYIHTYDLKRYKDFYREPPYIEDFTFKFFSEYEGPQGAIQALRAKRVDGLNFVPHDMRDKVERKYIDLHVLQLPQYTALFFNQEEKEALKESKVRAALEHAIDKERILRQALKNEGEVIFSPILPGFPGYNPEITKTEYNVNKSNELLDEIWPRITAEKYIEDRKGALLKEWEENNPTTSTTTSDVADESGQSTSTLREFAEKEILEQLKAETNEAQVFYRENKDGDVLEVNLVTADTQEYHKTADFIVGFWKEIGIKTNVSFVNPKEFSRTVLKERDYDILLYGMILGSDPDQFPFWHSSQADFPGLNLAQYVNRNVDTLLETARESNDEEKTVELYRKFQDIILGERPAAFLYRPTYTYATINDIKGVDVVRIFHPSDRFANVTEWYMNTKMEWKK